MHEAVAIDAYADGGLYMPLKSGEPRFLVFPREGNTPAAAIQLDATRDRPAFTLVVLKAKPLAFARWAAPLAITVDKQGVIRAPHSTLGAAVLSHRALTMKVRNAHGEVVPITLGQTSEKALERALRKPGAWLRWTVEETLRDGSQRVLFESHPDLNRTSEARRA